MSGGLQTVATVFHVVLAATFGTFTGFSDSRSPRRSTRKHEIRLDAGPSVKLPSPLSATPASHAVPLSQPSSAAVFSSGKYMELLQLGIIWQLVQHSS